MNRYRSLKRRAKLYLKNPSIVLQKRLHSFSWSLLEISLKERLSTLSENPTHILPENLLQRSQRFISDYLVNHLV